MKKYRVTVNGTAYEIELEELTGAAPAPAVAPAGGAQVKAPMPGTILDVKVQNGQSVKKGTVLCVLEAMKMENEIQAPCDGKITSLNVRKGDSVETQALICTIG